MLRGEPKRCCKLILKGFFVMQTSILVLFFGLGLAMVAASVTLYAFLPASLMNGASRNGRYFGLAALEQPRGRQRNRNGL
jgi:hypothetical protein